MGRGDKRTEKGKRKRWVTMEVQDLPFSASTRVGCIIYKRILTVLILILEGGVF